MIDVKDPGAQVLRFALAILTAAWLTSCASVSGPNAIGELSPVYSPETHVVDLCTCHMPVWGCEFLDEGSSNRIRVITDDTRAQDGRH